MIADTLSNVALYRGLSPRIALAFDYLRDTDFQRAATGTFEIDGQQVYAIVQDYATIDRTQGAWEAHRQYIDLQYVVSGTERIGYAHMRRLTPDATIRRGISCRSRARAPFSRSARATSCSFSPKMHTCRASP